MKEKLKDGETGRDQMKQLEKGKGHREIGRQGERGRQNERRE